MKLELKANRLLLLGVPLAILVVASSIGFGLLFERVEVETEVGFQGEARRDPMLLAERFLAAMAVPTTRGPSFDDPLPEQGVVVLAGEPGTLSRRELDRLTEWIERGGVLIALAQPLLTNSVPVALVAIEGTDTPVVVKGPHGGEFEVWMPATPRFGESLGDELLDLAPGVALDVPMGEGHMLLLASLEFLTNERLGDGDHAAFLWELVRAGGTPVSVQLISRRLPISLFGLVLGRGWPVLLSGFSLLVLWSWRHGARVGPVVEFEALARRSLIEHIRASGEFLWRSGATDALLDGLRSGVRRRAAQRHPGWKNLPEREQIQRMAELGKIPGGSLAKALEDSHPRESSAFVRIVRNLDSVWRSL